VKSCSLLFVVVLSLTTAAWAEPNDVGGNSGSYDANDLYPVKDANDIQPIDANDYGVTSSPDPNQTVDPNAVTVPTSVVDANDTSSTIDPNGLIASYHGLDPNSIRYLGDTSSDSNAANAYDDSNIHSALGIINPIRLSAGNSGATESLTQTPQSVLPTLTSVTVTLASPSSSDTVTAAFAGRKGANYLVDHVDLNVRGNLITVNVTWRRDALTDGPMADYSQTQSLGTLSAGTYTLQVRGYYSERPCASMVKFFTVAASSSSTTGSGGSLWDWLSSRFSNSNSNSNPNPFANWPFASQLN
jgi:hypothetical protein